MCQLSYSFPKVENSLSILVRLHLHSCMSWFFKEITSFRSTHSTFKDLHLLIKEQHQKNLYFEVASVTAAMLKYDVILPLTK